MDPYNAFSGSSDGVVYAKFPVFPLKSMLKVQGENSTELPEEQISPKAGSHIRYPDIRY